MPAPAALVRRLPPNASEGRNLASTEESPAASSNAANISERTMTRHQSARALLAIALAAVASAQRSTAASQAAASTAVVGATIIDGNGGPPIADRPIVMTGNRITAVGPRASVTVPPGATVIDGAGKFVTPGFIDTNVHVSMYGGGETMVRYFPRHTEVVVEAAQLHLKHGVTTVRDSYGM